MRILRRRGNNIRFVICRTTAAVENEPTVTQPQHYRVALADDFGVHYLTIEFARAVLIIDDEKLTRTVLSDLIRAKGYAVVTAEDGASGLAAAQREKPNVIILDVMMPGRDGWEVCRAIREDAGLDNTGVIMLTGIGERLNEMTSPLYGADDFEFQAQHGLSVLYAENGNDGIEMLKANPDTDLVLMDVMMPVMDGYETTQEIRKLPAFQALPIISLTAKAMPGDREKSLEAGASDYITKPVDPDEVKARLHVAERILGLRKELEALEGLLPICSYCKRIRNDQDQWSPLEGYIQQHSKAEFSHGICPDCIKKFFPGVEPG